MITTEKNIPKYKAICSTCSNEITFVSNQKPGALEYYICECYSWDSGTLNSTSKYRSQMNRDTETTGLRRSIFQIFQELQMPVTVRQMYYQLIGKGFPKTEAFYGRTQRELLHMRQEGVLPYQFIIDNSRRRIKYPSYCNGAQALDQWMRHYRQQVWESLDTYCEIWLEKRALQAIFEEVCYEYDVPLCVTSGFSSESFIFDGVTQMKLINKPVVIFYFSDYDPSGIALSNTVKDKLTRFGVKDFEFNRVALTQDQISTYSLSTRTTKKSNHSKGFEGESCELDALHPRQLVEMIRQSISSLIPEHHMKNIQNEESVQRQTLENVKLLMQA